MSVSRPPSDNIESPPRPAEGWAVAVLFLITAFLFIPSLAWVLGRAMGSGQLQHALLVMIFAAVFLIWDRKDRLAPEFHFSNGSWRRLCLSFGLLVPGLWLRGPWLVFPAMCCALSAWTIYLFGPRAQRLSDTLFGAFGIYLAFLLLFPSLDWPLRVLAGKGAAESLQWMGLNTDLFQMVTDRDILILAVDRRPFEVASECNGFGLMSSAGLLALIFFSVGRTPWELRILAFPLGLGLGLLFNILRIILICLLAPIAGKSVETYDFIHEVIGAAVFWGCLLLVRGASVWTDEWFGRKNAA